MKGDTIVIESHHRAAGEAIAALLASRIRDKGGRRAITVAGESGSGKSETAKAIAESLEALGIGSLILQQDDYFVYPPKTNDKTRRADIGWVGPKEVRLDLMQAHVAAFKQDAPVLEKPLVDYAADRIEEESLATGEARVLIAEGTYTTLIENADWHVFIDRDYARTRAHREKRRRDASELDPFIDRVLEIEHEIISTHKARAHIVIDDDYSVREV